MKTEPLVTLASITAGATALLGLLVAFGVPLTEGQQVAVLAVVAVAAPFVVALAGRGQVTPNASVVEYVNPASGVVKAGAANELPTDTVVRSLRNNDDDNAGPGAGHVGRLAHGGRVPPKPEKDNGLGRVMPLSRKIAAILASIALTVTTFFAPVNAPKAQAAGFGMCSKWITTYKSFLGVEITRGHVVCAGNIPGGTQYRAKIYCSKWAAAQIRYGKWKKEWSGTDSYNSCSWPWRIDDVNDISIEVK